MIGSIDYMHWQWKNCPTAWQGDYVNRKGQKSIILEAVAGFDTWVWHAFFGVAGSQNDLNVLGQSPVFNDVLRGEAPNITYEINNTIYQNGYYLADGIYPRWTTFVKTIPHPRSHKQKFVARYQEGYIKDVERCFGILQARWAIIEGVARLFNEEVLRKKETRVVLSVKMVSQQQTKDSGSKKLGMVAPQDKSSKEMKSSKKMKFASSSAETEPTSQTTISDDSKSTGRGMSTMPRVVKRKLQKLRPIVEYNKMGKGIGQAHIEMQSYIGVLARSRVPLVDKKWSQIPKDVKEQIWEAVDMAFVVGQGGKKSVLASAAKKWKDFKSTLTRHYILPYTNDKEKLSHPPETYKFIEKAQWDAFVASRLSQDFESVHSQHAQIREKLEYNHRLSRKGYAGLEDELEETMPGVEIDRSTLWKRARQDKHGNIPDPKVAEKAKLIDELQKQVSEGKVRVDGSKDVLTIALGPEHPGRLRGVGAGISPRQYFNLPKPQRVSFDDRLKESLKVLLQEETKKMEAKAKEEALRMEARTKQLVEAEREHFLSQLSQLIPNFDPGMLKQRISQSPKNPMSDKASCSGGEVKSLHYEDDKAKNGEHQQEEEKEEEKRDEKKEEEKEKKDEEKHDDKVNEVGDYSNMEAPSSFKSLCRYVETTLLPEDKILEFTIDKEVFGGDRETFLLPEDITQFAGMEEIGATVVAVYMRHLHDVLKQANMCSMVGFIDPATISANSGTIADRSRLVAARLQKTDGEQIFMMPYNPGLVSLGFYFYDFQ
ncbi:hypothetical protein L3X38_003831 [Prunus dulcis]|uniref:Uncharacterized protein n=1 Tax=Prunus dulcis TaxID=3755 RepID=A0AAD4ZMU3_PRUDU|nr:hypothetical protein L3X38_003831 [Prunus dulcis]